MRVLSSLSRPLKDEIPLMMRVFFLGLLRTTRAVEEEGEGEEEVEEVEKVEADEPRRMERAVHSCSLSWM